MKTLTPAQWAAYFNGTYGPDPFTPEERAALYDLAYGTEVGTPKWEALVAKYGIPLEALVGIDPN